MGRECSKEVISGEWRKFWGQSRGVVLSSNDRPEVRDVFRGFLVDEVRLTYTAGRAAPKRKAGELIISNRSVVPGFL